MSRQPAHLALALGLFAVGVALAPAARQDPDPLGPKAILDARGGKPVTPRPLKVRAAERLKVAKRVIDATMARLITPPSGNRGASLTSGSVAEELLLWLGRETDAKLDLAVGPRERVDTLNAELARTGKLAELVRELAEGGISGVGKAEVDKLDYALLELEERLARETAAK